MAELASLWIEGDLAEIILLVFVVGRIVLLLAGHVIEGSSVRREHRGVLAPVLGLQQRVCQDLMRCRVVDKHVARKVEHLDALIPDDMESLTRLIGRESAVFTTGMPVGIDHRTTQLVVAGLQPLALALDLEHRGAMIATDVEDELLRIRLMGTMTVDAHAWHLGVLDDGKLVEVREVALVEAHLTEHLVAWGDTAIGQSPLVEGIRTDAYLKVLILAPLALAQHADSESQLSALVLSRQLVPVVDIEIGEVALHMQFSALAAFHHDIYCIDIVSHGIEVQGGDLCRYRHVDIVRIDLRQFVDNCRILHLTSTS